MKELLGVVLMIFGIVLGVYLGFWVMFVGGIMDVIRQVGADNISAMSVAWGVLKIIFAGTVGVFTGGVVFLFGFYTLSD